METSKTKKHIYSEDCTCEQCSEMWRKELMKAVERGERKLKNKYIKWLRQINDLHNNERLIFIKWLSQKNNSFSYGHMGDYFNYIYYKYRNLPYPKNLKFEIELHLIMIHISAMFFYNKIKDRNEKVDFYNIITELPLSKINNM
ncbi:hypothetical protein LCGC14_0794340 [marine sediment metagenome]|uniref:Uncharacterized protein n=1 Tax=marine sediment metagenome TaxID=412755 RepID=A0A0F9QBH0_9ZZZZ